jgi:3-dehydroquinate dehydratase-2
MKIAIVNGPNLNLLGSREPDVYGLETFDAYYSKLCEAYSEVEMVYYQSNVEGEIINHLQSLDRNGVDGILINAGAYTHTSLAIADTIAAIQTPVVEVHVSNIFKREGFRHVSYLGSACVGSISGFGLDSYKLGLMHFLNS